MGGEGSVELVQQEREGGSSPEEGGVATGKGGVATGRRRGRNWGRRGRNWEKEGSQLGEGGVATVSGFRIGIRIQKTPEFGSRLETLASVQVRCRTLRILDCGQDG